MDSNNLESKKITWEQEEMREEREEQNRSNKNTPQSWIPKGTLTLRGELPTSNHHKVLALSQMSKP